MSLKDDAMNDKSISFFDAEIIVVDSKNVDEKIDGNFVKVS